MNTVDTMIRDIKQLESSVESSIKLSNDSVHNSPLVIKGVLGYLILNNKHQIFLMWLLVFRKIFIQIQLMLQFLSHHMTTLKVKLIP
jgi:hypothetical protein